MSRKPNNHTGLKVVLILLILAMIAATAFVVKLCLEIPGQEPKPSGNGNTISMPTVTEPAPVETTEAPTETTMPEPEHVVSTATIGAMGDLLMHMPIFSSQYNAACDTGNGTYDFSSVFQYLKEYTSALDYAAANLETTLCGTDNGYGYSGYPHFNCPDDIVDGAKDAGFDMLLTANNHSYDTGMTGFKRTVEVVREKGLETLGGMASAEDPKWTIQDINGINIGMMAFTYAYSETEGRPSLNGNPHMTEAGLCNYFCENNLPAFYTQVETYLAEMEEAGAEATILYIHWGVEYITYANDTQKAMAQKLCDLGVDVIIGGHPHVVEPVALLTNSVDPEQKTVCIYSLGNAVSNQRLGNISYINTAHTEDGILFTVTFEKYSDGTVYLANTDAIPTWVNKHQNGSGKVEFNILPLDYDCVDEWGQMFGIGDSTLNAAKNSYARTMEIVGSGIAESQEYLAREKEEREAYYYDLAMNPEKFAGEAA